MEGPTKRENSEKPKRKRKRKSKSKEGNQASGSSPAPGSAPAPVSAPVPVSAPAPASGSVISNEDYNERSSERTEVLEKIKRLLKDAPVTPVFWAICHLADMNRLQDIALSGQKVVKYIGIPLTSVVADCESLGQISMDTCSFLTGTQRSQNSKSPPSETTSRRSEGPKRRKLNSDGLPSVLRSATEKANASPYCPVLQNAFVGQYTQCKERDGHRCILTKRPKPEAAHIFPYCMLDPRRPTKQNESKPDFWESLELFWDKDRIDKWRKKIFPDSENPNVGVDRCFNLLFLSRDAHDMWNRGLFALKPLNLSPNQKELTVQIFLQPPGKYEAGDRIDLLTKPTSTKGLAVVGDGFDLHRLQDDGSSVRICSGDVFTITTTDPEKMPLPSVELLEMQWHLQRLVGMSGAAGWSNLDDSDDDSIDDGDCWPIRDSFNVHDSLNRVRDWVSAEAAEMTAETSTPEQGGSVVECY